MKYWSVFLVFVLVWSCSSETEKSNEDRGEVIIDEVAPNQPSAILSKVYDAGSLKVLNDDCTFNTDCDCCHDELIINPDSTFYYMAYCGTRVRLLKGRLSTKNEFVILVFDGYIITIDHSNNESSVTEKTAIFTKKVYPTDCNGKTQLIFVEENGFYAIENGGLYLEAVQRWNMENSR